MEESDPLVHDWMEVADIKPCPAQLLGQGGAGGLSDRDGSGGL